MKSLKSLEVKYFKNMIELKVRCILDDLKRDKISIDDAVSDIMLTKSINSLDILTKSVLNNAVIALYNLNSSEYQSVLYDIVSSITKIEKDTIVKTNTIKKIYCQLNPDILT